MIRKISVIILLFFLVIACDENDKPKRPDNLISKDKMSDILHDLYIINGAKGVNRKLLESNGFMPETYVLTKYNIDSTQFADSNAYYAFDTDTYKSIVDQVKARLEKEKAEFEELQKNEGKAAKVKRDSLKNLNQSKRDSLNKIKERKKDSIKKSLDSLTVNVNSDNTDAVSRKVSGDRQSKVVISNAIPTLTGSAQVLLLNDVPAAQTGVIKSLRVNAIEDGMAQFQVVKRLTFNNKGKAGFSDTFKPISLHSVAVTVGVNDYEVDIPIKKGEYLAWASTPGQPSATYGATVGTGWWQGESGPMLVAKALTYQPLSICFSYEISGY